MSGGEETGGTANTDHLNAPKKRLLYLIAAIAQGLGAIVVQPFAIRMMDGEEWGTVSFLLSLIAISLVAITAGFPLALTTLFFDRDRGVEKARALNGFGSLGSVAIGLGVVLVMFGVGAATGQMPELPYFLAVFIIALHGISQMTLAFLRSEGRAGAYVIVITLATVLGHFAGLMMMQILQPTALVYLTSFAVCVLLSATLGLRLTKPSWPGREIEGITTAARMAIPVLPHSLALIILQQGESVLLMITQGEVIVGRYNAVMPLALGPIAVLLALGNVWQTILISLGGERNSRRAMHVENEAAFVSFLLVLLGSGAAAFATHVLVNQPEPELFQLARILPLLGVGYALFMIASSQFFALRKTAIMSVITPVVAVLTLGVAVWPATSGSLVGVGVVKVCGYLALGLWFFLAVRKAGPQLMHARPTLLVIGASIAVTLVSLFLPTDFVASLVALGVSLLVAACLGALFVFSRRRVAA